MYLGITDQPLTLHNVTFINATNGIQIDWDPLTITDCATSIITVTYNVTVTSEEGNSEGDIALPDDTSALITNLIPDREYTISVMARIKDNSYACDSDVAIYSAVTVTDVILFLPPSSPTSQHSQPGKCMIHMHACICLC